MKNFFNVNNSNKKLSAENLQTEIINKSAEFLTKFKKFSTIDSKSIEDRLERLSEVGLSKIFNANALRSIIKDGDNEYIKFIESVKNIYPYSIIISWKDFYFILKKYNLAVGYLDEYKKLIPEKNLNDIIEASYKFNDQSTNFNSFNYMNSMSIYKTDNPKLKNSDLKKLVDLFGRLPLVFEADFVYKNFIDSIDYEVLKRYFNNNIGYSRQFNLSKSSWLIAAPIDDLKDNIEISIENNIKVDDTKLIEDPIVFKANKLGVIIVTMWDKESNDEIFNNYRNSL